MLKKTIFRILRLLISLAILLPIIFFALVYNGFFGVVASETEIVNFKNIEASIVYDAKGMALGKYYIQDRIVVTLNKVPPFLLKALVATEDSRFYSHNGIDFRSLMRVVVKSLILQGSSGGGSTITLQLAKNLFPRQAYKFLYYPINKTREAIIAYRMEKIYSKDEILILYLNTVSFGEDVYGVESASHRFFNKSASQLSNEQAAVLVGMLKATTSYNPLLHPQASRARRNIVLAQMVKAGELSKNSADSLALQALHVDYQPRIKEHAAYFLAHVKKKLKIFIDDYNSKNEIGINLLTDGLKIYTTIDHNMQNHAEKAMDEHMISLQKIFDRHWYDQELWTKHVKLLDREIKKVAHGRTPAEMQKKQNKFIHNLNGPGFKEMSPIDSIKYYLQQLQAGFLAMDPISGQIKSWVGGIDYQFFPYDHIDYPAKRQVGSTFKPIVYAAALEAGVSPCLYYDAQQASYLVKEGEWTPANDNANYEGKYTMEGALEKSVNTVSVKILQDVGIENTIQLANDMGISSYIPEVPSIALGTASISLIEMVTAYCIFVNGGYQVNPYTIQRIEDSRGNILYQYKASKSKRVLSEKTSRLIVHLLEGVVDNGTGRSIRLNYKLKNKIGGKTGTTQNNADGWFLAITPKLIAGAWVGGVYPEISFTSTRLGQGATMALPIFGKFYSSLNNDSNFWNYTTSQFLPMKKEWLAELKCDSFKEDFKLFDWIFGKNRDEIATNNEFEDDAKEEGFLKKVGNLFRKKKKD